jgi:20S proteasome alpha/beta subunit
MSQLIACKNRQGIILAADSRAVAVDGTGKIVNLQIERLHPLTSHSAILTGGAAAGENMCRALKDFVANENLNDIDEVYGAALPFLASEYERFMRRSCEFQPLDPIHQVNFILAGYTGKDLEHPFRMYLLWTKKMIPRLDGDELGEAFSVPRLMRLEYRLNQLCQADEDLEEVLPQVRQAMEKQALSQDEVAEPFAYAVITKEGFRRY